MNKEQKEKWNQFWNVENTLVITTDVSPDGWVKMVVQSKDKNGKIIG
jgi:hypothetical protein